MAHRGQSRRIDLKVDGQLSAGIESDASASVTRRSAITISPIRSSGTSAVANPAATIHCGRWPARRASVPCLAAAAPGPAMTTTTRRPARLPSWASEAVAQRFDNAGHALDQTGGFGPLANDHAHVANDRLGRRCGAVGLSPCRRRVGAGPRACSPNRSWSLPTTQLRTKDCHMSDDAVLPGWGMAEISLVRGSGGARPRGDSDRVFWRGLWTLRTTHSG